MLEDNSALFITLHKQDLGREAFLKTPVLLEKDWVPKLPKIKSFLSEKNSSLVLIKFCRLCQLASANFSETFGWIVAMLTTIKNCCQDFRQKSSYFVQIVPQKGALTTIIQFIIYFLF